MYSEQSQQKDSHRLDTTASLTGTSLCTYAIEPPCTERYARWCERSGRQIVSPSYSIILLVIAAYSCLFAHTDIFYCFLLKGKV